MKKILVISNMYPSKEYPHYGIFVKHTAKILHDAGNEIDISYMKKKDGKILKICSYIMFYLNTIWKILFGKYDVLYPHYASHTALPILIATKFKHIPIVVNVHGNDVIAETKNDEKYFRIVQKILKKSSYIICPSVYFKKSVINKFSVSENKIIVYPSGGVDTNFFKKIDRQYALEHFGLETDKIYIGYVSRIEANKGWDLFLKAGKKLISENNNIRLIVVGDGLQIKQYENLIDELEIKNYIYKYNLLSQNEILYIYNSLDVFVFPTYRKSESLGLVGLEAMSCRTLTVLPDKYGPTSYGIDNVNCFVFNSKNIESLVKTIKKALYNSKKHFIVENARKTALQYNHENTDEILVSCFSKL